MTGIVLLLRGRVSTAWNLVLLKLHASASIVEICRASVSAEARISESGSS
jgi:hypothetical protein